MVFIREKYGKDDFEKDIEDKKNRFVRDTKVLADYEAKPSHFALYFKGPLVLHQFEQYVGEENFKLLIIDFVNQKFSTNEELFNRVDILFGKEAVLELKKFMENI